VWNTDQVTLIMQNGFFRSLFLFPLNVTFFTRGLVIPLTMTIQTEAMIGAFQSRLDQVLRVGTAPMARTTGEHFAGRVVVMTDGASGAHFAHLSVELVSECYRSVKVR